MQKTSAAAVLLAAASLPLACGPAEHSDAPLVRIATSTALGPNTANTVLGQDFVDAEGRLWTCTGKAKMVEVEDVEAMFAHDPSEPSVPPPAAAPPPSYTVAELAELIRPVRLVGGYEYRLAQADTLVAERILTMKATPATDGHRVASPPPAPDVEASEVAPKYVFYTPNDDRWVDPLRTWVGKVQQNCSFVMIGPSTALCAAHCFYQNGGWSVGGLLWLGVTNYNPLPGGNQGNATYISGNGGSAGWYADSLTIPWAWINGAGSNNPYQTPAAHSEMDWDFAVLEFRRLDILDGRMAGPARSSS